MTKPDMALTIREILSRHTSVSMAVARENPIYDEGLSSLGINPKKLDLHDMSELREANQKRIEKLKAEMQLQEDLKNTIERDERLEKEVSERLEKRLKAEKEAAATR